MAVAVVGQGFYDAALRDLPATAAPDHSPQFRAQRRQLRDFPLDLGDMGRSDAVGALARLIRLGGHGEQFPHGIQREAQFARVANEGEPVAVVGRVDAGTAWPDLGVAAVMAGLFLYSSVAIFRQALSELRAAREAVPAR